MLFDDLADSVLKTIGRTPVVRLERLPAPGSADVFVKLEYFNPTGPYKDRMALAMIEGAEARGALRPGMRVIEYRWEHGILVGDGVCPQRIRLPGFAASAATALAPP